MLACGGEDVLADVGAAGACGGVCDGVLREGGAEVLGEGDFEGFAVNGDVGAGGGGFEFLDLLAELLDDEFLIGEEEAVFFGEGLADFLCDLVAFLGEAALDGEFDLFFFLLELLLLFEE